MAIEGADHAVASFLPDAAGVYVFEVLVTAGNSAGAWALVVVQVSERPHNTPPTAHIVGSTGSSRIVYCPVTTLGFPICGDCEADFALDGGGSWDGDGDALTYEWTLLTGAGPASLGSSSGPGVAAAIELLSLGPGDEVLQEAEVQLTVTDCMGATGSASALLTLECIAL